MFKATNHSKRDGSNYFALKLAGNRNVPFTPHPENPALWAECGVYFYLSQHQDDHGFTRGAPLGFSRLKIICGAAQRVTPYRDRSFDWLRTGCSGGSGEKAEGTSLAALWKAPSTGRP